MLASEISPDKYGSKSGWYQLESCYYDTEDLKFYQEKIGRKEYRKKIRIRRYVENGKTFDENSKVYVEIKERKGDITEKHRVAMRYKEARNFLENAIIPAYEEKDKAIINEIHELVTRFRLKPQTITQYDRQAFFGTHSDTGLRLTFDTAISYKTSNTNLGTEHKTDGNLIDSTVTILEMKALGKFPEHILKFFEQRNIIPVRISKYASAIESSQLFNTSKIA